MFRSNFLYNVLKRNLFPLIEGIGESGCMIIHHLETGKTSSEVYLTNLVGKPSKVKYKRIKK